RLEAVLACAVTPKCEGIHATAGEITRDRRGRYRRARRHAELIPPGNIFMLNREVTSVESHRLLEISNEHGSALAGERETGEIQQAGPYCLFSERDQAPVTRPESHASIRSGRDDPIAAGRDREMSHFARMLRECS